MTPLLAAKNLLRSLPESLSDIVGPRVSPKDELVLEMYVRGLAALLRSSETEPVLRPVCLHDGGRMETGMPQPIAVAGLHRIGDSLIENEIKLQLEHRASWDQQTVYPLQVLELGAGATHPGITSDIGAPWLARKLKLEHGDLIDMTISDGRGGMSKMPDRMDIRLEQSKHLVRLMKLEDRNPFSGMKSDRFGEYFDGRWDEQRQCVRFVRPVLDPEFERITHGLEVIHGVDIFSPKGRLEAGGYDVIFARHQHPVPLVTSLNPLTFISVMLDRHWHSIAKNITPCLAPGGVALIHVDDPRNFATRLFRVTADGRVTCREEPC